MGASGNAGDAGDASNADDLELVQLEQGLDEMARDLVTRVGGYPPFGAVLDDEGKVQLLFDQGTINGGATTESIDTMTRMVRKEAQAPNVRAAGVANMAYMNDESTGAMTTVIVLSLHHRAGRCIDFVTPFSKAASGAMRFGESVAGLGKTKFF